MRRGVSYLASGGWCAFHALMVLVSHVSTPSCALHTRHDTRVCSVSRCRILLTFPPLGLAQLNLTNQPVADLLGVRVNGIQKHVHHGQRTLDCPAISIAITNRVRTPR